MNIANKICRPKKIAAKETANYKLLKLNNLKITQGKLITKRKINQSQFNYTSKN